ncbi:hypothetical protein D3C85_1267890 [compost metagenome]
MPSLRSCSVGPPRSAIHGRTRLTRHPCRVAHCAEPALGLPTGQIKIKSQSYSVPVGAMLAREKRLNNAIIQTARVIVDVHREQASLLQGNEFICDQVGCKAASLLLLRCTPPREAEWRFCVVGNPAWMPG